MRPIYLDYNSTTPLDPQVFEVMQPYFLEKFGNAASHSHIYGWEADEAVDKARESIAQCLGSSDKKTIFFTSCATESNNLAIKGIVSGSGKKTVHLITQKTEHKCVLDSCREMEKLGHQVTYLDVDQYGMVFPDDVEAAIQPNTILCSILWANNEIGTLQPIEEIIAICHQKGILVHSDAVQAVGKISVDVEKTGVDLLSLSAHKIYGPKGIAALYVAGRKPPISLAPLLHGGGHERGFRSGTLNVPGIVGFAKALELCVEERELEASRLIKLRNHLIQSLISQEDVFLNGHPTLRLPNNVNVSVSYVRADELILQVPQIAISTGSACSSGEPEPSYVIQALNLGPERAISAIRIGLGRWTTEKDIDKALSLLVGAIKRLRAKSLVYEMKKGNR